MRAAVYNAVVGITGGYRQYLFVLPAARGALAPAAVATAAHDALVALYPSQQSALDTVYANYLGKLAPGFGMQLGIGVGHDAATQMIAARSNDGSAAVVPYTPGTAPAYGSPRRRCLKRHWTPGWGKVTPFLLRSGDQFRPAAPPALTSAAYTADFNEIKSVSAAASTTRTAYQTATAQFWVSTGPQLWNQAAQQLVIADHFTVAQTAHAFAAFNLISADSFIAAWDAKFTYNQWRPIMAIRNADQDGILESAN